MLESDSKSNLITSSGAFTLCLRCLELILGVSRMDRSQQCIPVNPLHSGGERGQTDAKLVQLRYLQIGVDKKDTSFQARHLKINPNPTRCISASQHIQQLAFWNHSRTLDLYATHHSLSDDEVASLALYNDTNSPSALPYFVLVSFHPILFRVAKQAF